MSGPALSFNRQAVTGAEALPGDTRDAPSWRQQIADGFLLAQADTTANSREVIDDAYDPLIEPLRELGYDTRQLVIGNRGGTYNYNGIWAAISEQQARGRFAELPGSREEFERGAIEAYSSRVAEAEERSTRGSLAPQLIGGIGGAMTDPLNLYSLPFGGVGNTALKRILSEGAINAGIELFQQPGVQGQREDLGRRDLTFSEAAANVGLGFAGGAAFRGAIEGAGAAARAARQLDPNLADKEFAQAFADLVPDEFQTAEQRAVVSILNRQADIDEASPFVRTYEGDEANFAKLQRAMDALEEGRIPTPGEISPCAGTPTPTCSSRSGRRGKRW